MLVFNYCQWGLHCCLPVPVGLGSAQFCPDSGGMARRIKVVITAGVRLSPRANG
ncbi:hypothetical protein J6590_030302 [Homalodisca vitripennis]|nr:hypothetical protein J6590_030302 [Homalodisca vitripennis]